MYRYVDACRTPSLSVELIFDGTRQKIKFQETMGLVLIFPEEVRLKTTEIDGEGALRYADSPGDLFFSSYPFPAVRSHALHLLL